VTEVDTVGVGVRESFLGYRPLKMEGHIGVSESRWREISGRNSSAKVPRPSQDLSHPSKGLSLAGRSLSLGLG
jgi:hypothetical protein